MIGWFPCDVSIGWDPCIVVIRFAGFLVERGVVGWFPRRNVVIYDGLGSLWLTFSLAGFLVERSEL